MADDADRAAEQAERLAARTAPEEPLAPIVYFACRRRHDDGPTRPRKTVLATYAERWVEAGWVVVGSDGPGKLAIEWPGDDPPREPVRFAPQRVRMP